MKVTLLENTPNAMGLIYRAYRICYSKDSPTEIKIPMIETSIGDKPDKDKLIEFIKDKLDKKHESCLEHVSFTFAIEGLSRAALAQLTRHRTFKFSVQSQRYINANNFDFVIPDVDEDSRDVIENTCESLINTYNTLIENGVKKEDARSILPNATTCNLIVTCDLRNFRNFLNLRLCNHAQDEIQELASKMRDLASQIIPFVDYKVMNCGITCFECANKGE